MINIPVCVTRFILSRWPLQRGRGLATRILLLGQDKLCGVATFHFNYGVFCDISIEPWPRGYQEVYLYGESEREQLRVWKTVLRRGDVVVDGGANCGYWSLVASSLVGKEGEIIAFEPVPRVYAALCRNLAASKATNVRARECALFSTRGQAKLFLSQDDPSDVLSSMAANANFVSSEYIECPQTTIDDEFRMATSAPRLIKLDVEGAELFALQGAKEMLRKRDQPVITFEWNVLTASGCGYHPTEILKFLSKHGYRFYLAHLNHMSVFEHGGKSDDWTPMVWAFSEEHLGKWGVVLQVRG